VAFISSAQFGFLLLFIILNPDYFVLRYFILFELVTVLGMFATGVQMKKDETEDACSTHWKNKN
jgi:hypothetical protein